MRFRLEQVDALAQSIPARTIASTPIEQLQPDTPASVAWARLNHAAADFDTALIVSDGGVLMCVRRDPAWEHDQGPVGRHSFRVPESATLTQAASLEQAVEPLSVHGYCVLLDDGGLPAGIITVADLQRPAAALWAFGLILSLESAAAMLFPSLLDRRWLDVLPEDLRKSVGGRIRERRGTDQYLSDVDCLYFKEKLDLTRKALELGGLMPIASDDWAEMIGSVEALRNDLAHGRGLGSSTRSSNIAILLGQTQNLTQKLWELVDDRDDVWERYARTECLADIEGRLARIEEARQALPALFWMISAQNPWERVLSDDENEKKHHRLVRELTRRGCLYSEGEGRAPGGEGGWRELMVLAHPLDRSAALTISREYGQRSVFEIDGDVFRVLEVKTGAVRRERTLRRGEGSAP